MSNQADPFTTVAPVSRLTAGTAGLFTCTSREVKAHQSGGGFDIKLSLKPDNDGLEKQLTVKVFTDYAHPHF